MSVSVSGTATTTGVGAERAKPRPNRFVALTPTLSVCPTSAEPTTCIGPVPPAMWTQADPDGSQRCQVKTNVIGCAPLHDPGAAVNVCPCWALPEMVGGDVFTGAAVWITAVASEVAVPVPYAFEAVTVTRSV